MKRIIKVLAIILVIAMVIPGITEASQVGGEIGMKRLSGTGRIQTSIKVSQEVYPTSDSVVLAGYSGEVDALTGTLLAAAKNAPLLLTFKDKIEPDLSAELERLKVKTVYILGGESVVYKAVETELAKTYTVKRIAGSNRESTAVAVANEVKGQSKHIFLAKGYGVLADALAIGPVSAIKDMPVLLTGTDKLPQTTIDAMKNLGVTHVTIVGGYSAVSQAVENQLKGYTVDRISGSNRENTTLAIANRYFNRPDTVVVANGYVFADALVGGYLGALLKSPILLTQTDTLAPQNRGYLRNKIQKAYILGGEKAVSSSVFKNIQFANEVNIENANYIGNRNTMAFHKMKCRALPDKENRVYFENREDASGQGFTACKICKP